MLPEKPCILEGPRGQDVCWCLGTDQWICPRRSLWAGTSSDSSLLTLAVCVYVCDSVPVTAVCVRRRVPRLVYTSTVNVAFGGKPIEQGDEDSVPYFPLEKVPGFQERWAGSVGRKGWGQPQVTAQGVSQEEGVPSTGWHRPALILPSRASRDCEIRWTWP